MNKFHRMVPISVAVFDFINLKDHILLRRKCKDGRLRLPEIVYNPKDKSLWVAIIRELSGASDSNLKTALTYSGIHHILFVGERTYGPLASRDYLDGFVWHAINRLDSRRIYEPHLDLIKEALKWRKEHPVIWRRRKHKIRKVR